MTNQEAIGIIKTAIAQVELGYPTDYAAAFDIAVAALKKQDPQIVGDCKSVFKDSIFGNCPNCSKQILTFTEAKTNFCKFCGQAVKWE